MGASKKVGPHLNGIFGRPAGTSEGYSYSKAMIEAGEEGLIWTEETLDEFMVRPKTFIKKTKMNFSGLRKKEDRRNLIAFLREATRLDENGNAADDRTANDPKLPEEVLAIVGDRDYGEYLSGTCVGCHQEGGEDKGIPSITGWPKDAFVTVMYSYRSKFRENPVMQQVAGSLNNEEIAGLAAYFEELKPPQ